jgi:hypothetical protein
MTEQALQFSSEAFFLSAVMKVSFVGEVGVALCGVQRIELINIALGPREEVGHVALDIGGDLPITQ